MSAELLEHNGVYEVFCRKTGKVSVGIYDDGNSMGYCIGGDGFLVLHKSTSHYALHWMGIPHCMAINKLGKLTTDQVGTIGETISSLGKLLKHASVKFLKDA